MLLVSRLLAASLAALVLMFLACDRDVPTVPAPPPESLVGDGELLFVRDGNIFRYELKTRTEHQLTSDGRSYDPAWSPDGRRIAFARWETDSDDVVSDIHLMDVQGTNVVRRTSGGTFRSPTWSPDGASLAIASDGEFCQSDCAIYVLEIASNDEPRPITALGSTDPAWSPDGSRIAYVSVNMSGYGALHATSTDGAHQSVLLPRSNSYMHKPSWSPDGEQVAYSGCVHMGCAIFTASLKDHVPTQLTDRMGVSHPAWSPAGQLIAVTLWQGPAIAIVPATGGVPQVIIGNAHSPAWRP